MDKTGIWKILRWRASMYETKSLSGNSGKSHGQNAHWTENRKQNLSPSTRHENAPVSTQGLCHVRLNIATQNSSIPGARTCVDSRPEFWR